MVYCDSDGRGFLDTGQDTEAQTDLNASSFSSESESFY